MGERALGCLNGALFEISYRTAEADNQAGLEAIARGCSTLVAAPGAVT
jgi:hypothetical protein